MTGFGAGFSNSFVFAGGFDTGLVSATSSQDQAQQSASLYSNIDSYIVNGSAIPSGASTSYNVIVAAIRSNIIRESALKVDSTVSVQGFKFIRVPSSVGNWTITSNTDIQVVLSVLSGGTINGGSGTKTYSTNSITLNPATGRYTGSDYNSAAALAQYDTHIVYHATPAVLTPGVYKIAYNSPSTQISVPLFYKSKLVIDTTKSIYPDTTNALNATYYPVIEILSTAP